ncbi:MAG: transaldolase family protein, partial [Acidiphilium sp.]|nr:transaldolase family protein [Acidiphilium sp.]
MNPLKQLAETGQAPWLDFVQRELIEGGNLAMMIKRDGLKGVTSNPSIFEKAIAHAPEYTKEFERYVHSGDHEPMAIYEHLAIGDIKAAADVLLPVYHETNGR